MGVLGCRRREVVAPTLVRAGELLALGPRLVGLLALPPGVDEELVGALLRAQQLEPLEAGGRLDRAGAATEALLEALLLVRGDDDRVDLDDAHAAAPSILMPAPLPAPANDQPRMRGPVTPQGPPQRTAALVFARLDVDRAARTGTPEV